MRNLIWNRNDDRLRLGWRLAIALALYLALTILPRALLTWAGFGEWVRPEGPADIAILVASLLTLLLVARYIDRRRFEDYGLLPKSRNWWTNFAFGIVMSAILVSIIFWMEFALTWVNIVEIFASLSGTLFIVSLAPSLLGVIATAIYIELWFRGFLVVNLAEGFGFLERFDHRAAVVAAWGISAIIYALLRIPEDGVNLVLLANLLRAGFLMALPFILTRNLGLSIGMNLGWNIMERHVYGFSITNFYYSEVSVLVVAQNGPPVLTGGELGPVAGLLGMFAMIVGGAAVIWWVRRSRNRSGATFNMWELVYIRPPEMDGDERKRTLPPVVEDSAPSN